MKRAIFRVERRKPDRAQRGRNTAGQPDRFHVRLWYLSAAGPDFAISNDGCSGVSISDGESCTFDLLFTPAAVGPRMTTLVVTPTSPRVTMIMEDTTGKGITPALDGGIQDSALPG